MQDNRKSSLVARISIQVVDYYRQAMRGLDDSNISSLLGSKKSKTWKKVLTIKMNHYTSVAFVSLLIKGGVWVMRDLGDQPVLQMTRRTKYGRHFIYISHLRFSPLNIVAYVIITCLLPS